MPGELGQLSRDLWNVDWQVYKEVLTGFFFFKANKNISWRIRAEHIFHFTGDLLTPYMKR